MSQTLTRISLGTSAQVGHVKATLRQEATSLDVGLLAVDQSKTAGKALDAGARLAPLLVP